MHLMECDEGRFLRQLQAGPAPGREAKSLPVPGGTEERGAIFLM